MTDHIALSEEIRGLQEKLDSLRSARADAIRAAYSGGTGLSAYRLAKDCGISQTAIHRIVKEGKKG